ncbi:MAG: acetylglutamate kinase [Spirochaetes bacterium]|nr:MAG: acetylglutamate kinase [Spirochaetota bacterium]
MQSLIDQANILIESLPYIKDFFGKTIVVKYGGSAMTDSTLKEKVIEDIVLMKLVGMKPVVVHGGGPAIDSMLKKTGKKPSFHNGLRITDPETMEVTEMVLSGKVNKEIAGLFQKHNIPSAGISGKDGNTILAKKIEVTGADIGSVGEVEKVNTRLISVLMENNFIPVIAPVSSDIVGNTYNINADAAASAIAGALKAEKLIYLTDTSGILSDINNQETLISKLTLEAAENLIETGVISGGMIPKIGCSINAVKDGVKAVHIIDGRLEHSLLLEIFTKTGIGTLIKKD